LLLERNFRTNDEETSISFAVVVPAIVVAPEKLPPLAAVTKPVLSTLKTVVPEGASSANRRLPAAGALDGRTAIAAFAAPADEGENVVRI
jgi:hypothetical protein